MPEKTNLDAIAVYVVGHYMPMIVQKHGNAGVDALVVVLNALRQIYHYVEPELIKGSIVIFKTLEDDINLIPSDEARIIIDLQALPQEIQDTFIIQILNNGQFRLWKNVSPDIPTLADQAVVYEYKNRIERFFAKNDSKTVPKIHPARASEFSIPTFSDLRAALEDYRLKMVRYCTCRILAEAWLDENRLFFKNAPEWIMRNSLEQHLRSSLRGDVEIRPEQIVDESNPVDIKITWLFSNRRALIEIKWLGKSKKAKGKITAKYYDDRAKKGAEQLAEYLDRNKPRAAVHITRGYLVIIDGRRYRLGDNANSIDRSNGLYYEHREIEFNPKFHEFRDDFERPIRMFVEPICK